MNAYGKKIKYHIAYDENGQIVPISCVNESERARHTYRCIGCGREMVVKLGRVNAHHFAHKVDE